MDCTVDTCLPAVTQTDADQYGHGTASAALASGGEAMGDDYRGVTRATLDSYKVYAWVPDEGRLAANGPEVLNAFQEAVTADHSFIIAELTDSLGLYGSFSSAADWAYDEGIAVFAAGGNDPIAPLPQPANAPRAMGIGMYCINSPTIHGTTGTTPDGRLKPDVVAPTGLRTAANCTQTPCTDSDLANFGGTSGATPSAAGAALLMRNVMSPTGAWMPPGAIYALLALCGDKNGLDPTDGAGRLTLPKDGYLYSSWISLKPGEVRNIEVDPVNPRTVGLDAAIWWPEYGTSDHGFPAKNERATITLSLTSPGMSASSCAVSGSVVQRASLRANGNTGRWTMTISAPVMPDGETRDVFYAIWERP
jgi:hypothetical protein